jgi:hypothetical protein
MDKIEDKLVLCKAITSIKQAYKEQYFSKTAGMYILMKSVKLKKMTPGRVREYIAEGISKEQASRMFDVMISKGYVEFAFPYKPRPGDPAKTAIGTSMYRLGQLRLTECMETNWYKNRERKEKFVKKEEQIDFRSCKALQQIYTMFGSIPFSYKTVTQTVLMISKLADDKSVELNKAEIMALKHMKAKLYSHNVEGFRDVWQSLIRNGYIVQHKIKTSDGYIKNTGLYIINHAYLKHCLAELI